MISPKDVVRHRFTAQQRQRLVARFHQSQLTRKEFVARHGLGFSTLSKWLQDERHTGKPAVSFQEMVMPTAATKWAVEVTSPNHQTTDYRSTGLKPPAFWGAVPKRLTG